MPRATFSFPNGFIWGTATAAHQVEGNNTNNDWWAWEQGEGHIKNGDKSGKACDWWNGRRWTEDFDRAQATHQTSHRFSIEWSRVQPEPDRWDEAALDRYREMLIGLKERGMSAMLTLHHFSSPVWFSEMGGWESDQAVTLFNAFVKRTVEALKAHCNLWVPVNEPNVYGMAGFVWGDFPPGKHDLKTGLKVIANMAKGHAAAYKTIHELQSDAMVGTAINWRDFVPGDANPLSNVVVNRLHKAYNDAFTKAMVTGKFDAIYYKEDMPEAVGAHDFVGLNYYTRDYVKFNLSKPNFAEQFYRKDAERSYTGFLANEPDGFRKCIRWGGQFGLPIYVTENGWEDPKDDTRRIYLLDHLLAMWHEVNNNLPVKGYYHWSLVDNFEWERGWSQRFGLWGLEPATQQRIRRQSVDLYSEICRTNSINSETVEKWAPECYKHVFPD